MRPDTRRPFRTRGVVRGAVGRRDLGEAKLADVTRQGRLRHIEPLGLETRAQLLLTANRLAANDSQDGRVTLGFHVAEMWCTIRPLTTVRAAKGGEGRRRAAKGNTARSAALPTSSEPISFCQPRARAPSIVSARMASLPSSAAASASAH